MRDEVAYRIKRSLFWLCLVLPLDIAKNIKGISGWWIDARGWVWDKEQNVNDLVYFLSWDLSWLAAAYFFFNIVLLVSYLLGSKRQDLERQFFYLWLLSVTVRALAWNNLVDEFTNAITWHIGQIVVNLLIAVWCFKKISQRLKDKKEKQK